MSKRLHPRYPVYVISKGRYNRCLTAKLLLKDDVAFRLVIEPQEESLYKKNFPKEIIDILPFSNLGQGSIPARNWVWEDAIRCGYQRHWILDDNIRVIYRRYKTYRVPCNTNIALSVTEDFVDRFKNVGVAGLNYDCFCEDHKRYKPFTLNCHVYSCLLINHDLPYRWRGRYNEDTDLCLQVLSSGYWTTVLIHAYLIGKVTTMAMKGGNTDEFYKGDGRLKMARSLERVWPGVVETVRKFNRPQHNVKYSWQRFDTPLLLKDDVKLNEIKERDYGIRLKQVAPVIKNRLPRKMLEEENERRGIK